MPFIIYQLVQNRIHVFVLNQLTVPRNKLTFSIKHAFNGIQDTCMLHVVPADKAAKIDYVYVKFYIINDTLLKMGIRPNLLEEICTSYELVY